MYSLFSLFKTQQLFREFQSPRALFGMALALNKLSLKTMEKSKSLAKISKEELEEIKETRYIF